MESTVSDRAPAARAAEETMINRDGKPVPARIVPARRRLEDQTVRTLLADALAMREQMADFKTRAFGDIETFMELLSAQFNVSVGGRRGGTTLESFDGLMKVVVSSADSITFGPELSVAKNLIDDCISTWSDGANDYLRTLVMDAFSVGEGGSLRVDRILGLRQLGIDDPTWQAAMAAISDAVRTHNSKRYIRFYQRANGDVDYAQVPLDMSRL